MPHKLLKLKQYACWEELEREIAKIINTTEKGDVFEEFCFFYFCYFKNLYQIEHVYSDKIKGNEIPSDIRKKLKLAEKDDGVDGVFVALDGALTAYQCKFRSARVSPTSNELNDFWAEAENADYRLVFANTTKLPSDVAKRQKQLSVLVDRLDNLEEDFFLQIYKWATLKAMRPVVEKAKPYCYQKEILSAIQEGFSKVNRGKVVAACGIGKTLISLWASEIIIADTVLFLAPSLALVRQTLDEWSRNANFPFIYLCVCSDESITENVSNDEFELKQNEIDIPVTTDPDVVKEFLNKSILSKKVIFATYQSLEVVTSGTSSISDFAFDLMIFDEAHRTAGTKGSSLFALGLHDRNIKASKRLFLTATERLVKPWIRDRYADSDRLIFSMDDEELYGPLFYRLPFGLAIQRKIICDYRIIVPVVEDDELYELVQKKSYISDDENIVAGVADGIDSNLIHKAMATLKSAQEFGIRKFITFHASIQNAQAFTDFLTSLSEEFLTGIINAPPSSIYITHVNGTQTSAQRAESFHNFSKAKFGLISNVRCMTEGVDIPNTDGIVFADPKESLIDIVQAVGRALRRPRKGGEKTAYIVLPIVLPKMNIEEAKIDEQFQVLYNVIQALRDQDETLEEWVDSVNLAVVSGGQKARHNNRGDKIFGSKVTLILPTTMNIQRFENGLTLRIAEVNANPTGTQGLGYQLGKGQRKSVFKRVFSCFGDYNYDAYQKSLVDPTINVFSIETQKLLRSKLHFSNNNVSHTVKLGLIEQQGTNLFVLTEIGKSYFSKKVTFEQLFLNQMLLYKNNKTGNLYPYLAGLKIIAIVRSLNYIEFLYSVVTLQPSEDGYGNLDEACSAVNYIRNTYPNIELTSDKNKQSVIDDLNEKCKVDFLIEDVWTDRTTIGNKYRHFLNNMSLLEPMLNVDFGNKTLRVDEANMLAIRKIIERVQVAMAGKNFRYGTTVW